MLIFPLLVSGFLISEMYSTVIVHRVSRQAVNDECTTPEGIPGTCVPVNNCTRIWTILSQTPSHKLTTTQKTFLQKSKCKSQKEVIFVCCPECGHIIKNSNADRITDGRPVVLGTWPWIVALKNENGDNSNFEVLCGGSLVSDRWVVTAGHCIQQSRHPKIVRVGELNINENVQDGADPEDIPIAEIFVHPGYDYSDHTSDIALLRLNKSVTYSANVMPICLPNANVYNKSTAYNGKLFKIAGWGAIEYGYQGSSELLEANVQFVPYDDCRDRYLNYPGSVIDQRIICATKNKKDTCQGDSGGPLVIRTKTSGSSIYRSYLSGVVSLGVGCGNSDYPGIYTKVAYFMDWINEVMASKS